MVSNSKFCNVAMALYYRAKVVVTTTEGETGQLKLSAEVLQEATPAPHVFVLVRSRLQCEMCHTTRCLWH